MFFLIDSYKLVLKIYYSFEMYFLNFDILGCSKFFLRVFMEYGRCSVEFVLYILMLCYMGVKFLYLLSFKII